MTKYYLPREELKRVDWLNNFSSKLGGYAASFGITIAEVTAVSQFAQFYGFIIGYMAQLKTFTHDVTAYKNLSGFGNITNPLGPQPAFAPAPNVPPAGLPPQGGGFTAITKIVGRIKNTAATYSEAIGQDLGIIGADSIFDSLTAQPEISVMLSANSVLIDFTNPREVSGVRILCQRATEPGFTPLADDTHAPYADTRPNLVAGQAETRKYQAWYITDSHILGLVSDIVSISVNI